MPGNNNWPAALHTVAMLPAPKPPSRAVLPWRPPEHGWLKPPPAAMLQDCPACTGSLAIIQDAGSGTVAPVPPWTFDSSGYYLTTAGSSDSALTLTVNPGTEDYFATSVDAIYGISFTWNGECFDIFGCDLSPGISFNDGGFVNEATGGDANLVTGTLTYPTTFVFPSKREPCPAGAVIWDSNGQGDVSCDNFLVYSPNNRFGATVPYNLSSGAIEGFYYADAPWPVPSTKPPTNALTWLFQDSGYLANGGTVVANPLYPLFDESTTPPRPFTIGNLADSNYSDRSNILAISTPDETQQLDFRAGHFGRLHHNWITDNYSELPDAENSICELDNNPDDSGGSIYYTSECFDRIFFSTLPGWNSVNGNAGWYTTNGVEFLTYNSSAGIKDGIHMGGYYTGAGDVVLNNIDVVVKPAWIGASDEGVYSHRNNIGETPSYFGNVVLYTSGYPVDSPPTGLNTMRAVPIGNPAVPDSTPNAQLLGMFQPMLDETDDVFTCNLPAPSGCSGAKLTSPKSVPGLGSASVITDATASFASSVIGTIATLDVISPYPAARNQTPDWIRPTQNQPALYTITLQTPKDLSTLRQPLLLGMFLNGAGGLYEVVQVITIGDYNSTYQTQAISAFMRFQHSPGAAFLAGGLTGRYIEFPDDTTPVGQRYVQNVFGSSTSVLTTTYTGGLTGCGTSGTLTFTGYSNANGAVASAEIVSAEIQPLIMSNGGIEASAGAGTATVTPSHGATCSGIASITTTIGNSAIFGAMAQGRISSYPEVGLNVVSPYSYTIYHGADVEDERDPTPSESDSSNPLTHVCNISAPNTVDGCYVVLEDNDALWTAGATVENTNHISATWLVDRQGPGINNPYASVIGEQIDLAGPGGALSSADAIEMEAGVPAGQLQTISNGLYYGANGIVFGEINPFGIGIAMLKTPVGGTAPGFANHPDVLGVGAWWQCTGESGFCTQGTGSDTTDYYQSSYQLWEQVPDNVSGGVEQEITVNRVGTMQFSNLGTIFHNNGGTGPTVTVPTVATGVDKTDLAGELSFPGGPMTCADTTATACESYTFAVTTYTIHPECLLTPQFNTAGTGPPWVTYTGTTSMTINFATPPAGGQAVSFSCYGRTAASVE